VIITTKSNDMNLASRVHIMGILNLTPDSFSDGGVLTPQTLLQDVTAMVEAGVDILDIGGESSRPGAEAVSLSEELQRVIPAIQAIRTKFNTPISIDTTKAEVAKQALDAGANIINDISGLRFDPEMIPLAISRRVPVIIMHMQGSPGDMQQNPVYSDVIADIKQDLSDWIQSAVAQGLKRSQIILDPGIGFGKTLAHNLSILKHLTSFKELNCPILLGHSRKRFIGTLLDEKNPSKRDLGTAVISGLAVSHGISILRVHDVPSTVQAVKLAEAIALAV
jgi:dihydropteroate synthase